MAGSIRATSLRIASSFLICGGVVLVVCRRSSKLVFLGSNSRTNLLFFSVNLLLPSTLTLGFRWVDIAYAGHAATLRLDDVWVYSSHTRNSLVGGMNTLGKPSKKKSPKVGTLSQPPPISILQLLKLILTMASNVPF